MTFAPTVLGSGTGGYAFLTRTRNAQQALFAQSPQVARETQEFLTKIKDVQTSDQLLDNRAMLKVALGAFGLDEDLNNRAFLKKILDSDLTDGQSMANRLADKRYLAFAQTFNFTGVDGPSMAGLAPGPNVANDLADIASVDALFADRSLLRATLATFGLESDVNNTFFLKSVLESDLTDENSFANRLGDTRYGDLARAFDLAGKTQAQSGVYGFAQIAAESPDSLLSAEALMADEEMLTASLKLFGLERDIDRTGFLASVLNSDLTDENSFANQLEDKRYAALADAFGFVDRAERAATDTPFTSKVDRFIAVVSSRPEPVETPKAFFQDIQLMLATFALFDLPPRPDGVTFANRILESDRNSPTSLINVFPDQRYRAFADALDLKEKSTERVYPAGFGEAIVDSYLNRQFETRIGEQDPTMRFALALERDLSQVVKLGTSNNSQWFAVMASKPLREVFETVFQLPDSFGTLDIDRQLSDLKIRSEQFFGTSTLADFTIPENLENLRQQFLVRGTIGGQTASGSGNLILSLLA